MIRVFFAVALLCALPLCGRENSAGPVNTEPDGRQSIRGLVTPLDNSGRNFYLRNAFGLTEVRLAKDAVIGILFRRGQYRPQFEKRRFEIDDGVVIEVPKQLYVKVLFPDWRSAQKALKGGTIRAGMVYVTKMNDHLPTEAEPYLCGRLIGLTSGKAVCPSKIVAVGDRKFTVSTKGYDYADRIMGMFTPADIKPFINQAAAYGRMEGDVFVATEVALRRIPDQTAKDDPRLPRYLFIGDSISGNYDKALRASLAGKLNVHHPPTNCGPSGKGKGRVAMWLGEYKRPGRHWDVISFNFGHWDAGNTKEDYQSNLEAVIKALSATGAKLIWVTTCPVPNGYPPAGDLKPDGKAPGRTAGVMKKYLNPWALEVMKRHPEIVICDQWQFVTDHANDLYADWWKGKNVHFKDRPVDELGKSLAKCVLRTIGRK